MPSCVEKSRIYRIQFFFGEMISDNKSCAKCNRNLDMSLFEDYFRAGMAEKRREGGEDHPEGVFKWKKGERSFLTRYIFSSFAAVEG